MTEKQAKELAALAARADGGLLTAEAVLDFASDKRTALHAEFLWDDTEAARLYRLDQARLVIRAYVTYEPRTARTVRGLVSVPSDRANTGGYRPVERVLESPLWTAELVAEVGAKVAALKAAYSYLSVLDGLWPRLEAEVRDYLAEMQAGRRAG